jgi:3-oxoacyl-[acyl-carrier protein] reductase
MRLDGRTALVIGGAGPAGAAIVRAMAQAGARVCVADANPEAAEALADDVAGMGHALDPLDDAAYARLAYDLGDAWGDLDILVNAVAPQHVVRPIEETSEADFDRIIALHTKPVHLASRHFVPAMKARGTGAILNYIAISGIYSGSSPGWHGPAKAWLVAATEAMAAELAPGGLRVNAILPVIDDSPSVPTFMGGNKSAARQQALSAIPLGRFAAPDDIGQAAVFLCSDAAAFLTGVILPVDGGRRL